MRESKLERHFVARVRALGGHTSKIVPIEAGIPDRFVLAPGGRIYLVELKADTGRLAPIQRLWHARAAKLGTTVHVLKGKDEVDTWLAEVFQ